MNVVHRIRHMCKGIFLNDIYHGNLHKMILQDDEITSIIKRIEILLLDAKNWLDQVQNHRKKMFEALTYPIENLDQLHRILKLLQQIRDLQNKTDQVHLAIEEAYNKLRMYGLQLPRTEVEDVKHLQIRWQNLVELSEEIEKSLFTEKRASFEQEIDGENMHVCCYFFFTANAFSPKQHLGTSLFFLYGKLCNIQLFFSGASLRGLLFKFSLKL
ncbi:unnamed protein product [Acanthosepion pharaonis]|uniref:Uncharacterized protein n=1 Tax=Acanthosepion pharaonis TaxID=158019 RepID=A0A812CLP5_ACAPH|nr:unnamed protein product [Sepia pharaonis]